MRQWDLQRQRPGKEDTPDLPVAGLAYWASGERYNGNFVRGEFNGDGVFRWTKRQYYSGNWVDSKRHGHGIMTWEDKSTYAGQWVDNKMTGKGMWSSGGQPLLEGIDEPVSVELEEGDSKIRFRGELYDVMWLNDDPSPKGKGLKIKSVDPSINGQVVLVNEHMFQNPGLLVDMYSGQFKDGKWHGMGVWSSSDGAQYNGLFKEGEIDYQEPGTWRQPKMVRAVMSN